MKQRDCARLCVFERASLPSNNTHFQRKLVPAASPDLLCNFNKLAACPITLITLSSKLNKSWLFWYVAVRMVLVTHVRLFFFSPLDHFRLLVLCSGKHHKYPVCDEAGGHIRPYILAFLPDCPEV